MRIAILIGVSEYAAKSENLPGCKQDVVSMAAVVEASGKFDEILTFKGLVRAADVKSSISQKVEALRGSKVDEVFFYYTGHGAFRDDEFFFVLSDYSEEKLRQTSLQNSEIDNWLRTLKPELAVKVVDACHSGLAYVKDKQYLEALLRKSIDRFKSCYFMFSSTSQQYSYQNETLSDFTRSFLCAVKNSSSETIRYKDIIDSISDDFELNEVQTPAFVTQASFTEAFAERTPKFVELVESVLAPFALIEEGDQPPVKIEGELTLEQMVRKGAERYRTKEEASALLLNLKETLAQFKSSSEFASLYDMEVSFEQNLESLPKKATIGEWLEKHLDEYFGSVVKEEESYQARVSSYYSVIRYPFAPEYETRYRMKIVGFELDHNGPYNWIRMHATPRYPNIPWCNCSIVIILSKSVIRFFYFFTEYVDRSWSDREPKLNFTWKTDELPLAEENRIRDFVSNLQSSFAEWVIEQVRKRLPQAEEHAQ